MLIGSILYRSIEENKSCYYLKQDTVSTKLLPQIFNNTRLKGEMPWEVPIIYLTRYPFVKL